MQYQVLTNCLRPVNFGQFYPFPSPFTILPLQQQTNQYIHRVRVCIHLLLTDYFLISQFSINKLNFKLTKLIYNSIFTPFSLQKLGSVSSHTPSLSRTNKQTYVMSMSSSSSSSKKSFLSRRFSISKSLREFRFSQPVHSTNDRRDEDRRTGADASESSDLASSNGVSWSTMLPELLGEIIRRLEDSEDRWPQRRNVVVCGCVCKRWREVTKEIVTTPLQSGKITFPSCLKQV